VRETVSEEMYVLRATGGIGGKQESALEEIVWTKVNVVESGGREEGRKVGREGRGEGGKVENRPMGVGGVTPLRALESARSLPVLPV